MKKAPRKFAGPWKFPRVEIFRTLAENVDGRFLRLVRRPQRGHVLRQTLLENLFQLVHVSLRVLVRGTVQGGQAIQGLDGDDSAARGESRKLLRLRLRP